MPWLDYLAYTNANHGGPFLTSRRSDSVLESAHQAMADFLNAPSAREIVMGPNMTSLTFQFSRAIGRGARGRGRDPHHPPGPRREPVPVAGA